MNFPSLNGSFKNPIVPEQGCHKRKENTFQYSTSSEKLVQYFTE